METSRRNKRTNCSPKPKIADSQCTRNSQKLSNNDEQNRTLAPNPSRTKQNTPSAKKNQQLQDFKNDGKRISYKIQNYAKIISETPERITRERNQDHEFFTTANAQIFQVKVAYFPGKKLEDIRQLLTSNNFEETLNGKSRISRYNSLRRSEISTKEKTFGKHLMGSKKKSKKLKVAQKPLNTIEEVNENERSKESLKKEIERTKEIEDCSSIVMSYTDVGEDCKSSVRIVESKESSSISHTPDFGYVQKTSVSYSFQKDESRIKSNGNHKSEQGTNRHFPDFEANASNRVFQIREMFEKLSKSEGSPEKEPCKGLHTNLAPLEPIHFEHAISCEECRRILKDLIEAENVSKKDVEVAMSGMPHDASRRIVDSLVQEICERVEDQKSSVSFKIETRRTTTVHKVALRRGRRKRRRGEADVHDLQYKNFFLLALAISIVLYCFYCRLNEKKS